MVSWRCWKFCCCGFIALCLFYRIFIGSCFFLLKFLTFRWHTLATNLVAFSVISRIESLLNINSSQIIAFRMNQRKREKDERKEIRRTESKMMHALLVDSTETMLHSSHEEFSLLLHWSDRFQNVPGCHKQNGDKDRNVNLLGESLFTQTLITYTIDCSLSTESTEMSFVSMTLFMKMNRERACWSKKVRIWICEHHLSLNAHTFHLRFTWISVAKNFLKRVNYSTVHKSNFMEIM